MAAFAIKYPKELAFVELHHHASYLDPECLAIEQQVFDLGVLILTEAQSIQALRNVPAGILLEFAQGAFVGVFRAGIEGRLPLTLETFQLAEQCAWEAVRA
jgi:TetR/AcrR family transcriptional regulator, repressor of fatR-cypB operon